MKNVNNDHKRIKKTINNDHKITNIAFNIVKERGREKKNCNSFLVLQYNRLPSILQKAHLGLYYRRSLMMNIKPDNRLGGFIKPTISIKLKIDLMAQLTKRFETKPISHYVTEVTFLFSFW